MKTIFGISKSTTANSGKLLVTIAAMENGTMEHRTAGMIAYNIQKSKPVGVGHR